MWPATRTAGRGARSCAGTLKASFPLFRRGLAFRRAYTGKESAMEENTAMPCVEGVRDR